MHARESRQNAHTNGNIPKTPLSPPLSQIIWAKHFLGGPILQTIPNKCSTYPFQFLEIFAQEWDGLLGPNHAQLNDAVFENMLNGWQLNVSFAFSQESLLLQSVDQVAHVHLVAASGKQRATMKFRGRNSHNLKHTKRRLSKQSIEGNSKVTSRFDWECCCHTKSMRDERTEAQKRDEHGEPNGAEQDTGTHGFRVVERGLVD